MISNEETSGFQSDLLGRVIGLHYFEKQTSEVELMIDQVVDEPMSSAYFFRDQTGLNAAELEALTRCRGRILDVGAGAGCHSLILQARGFDVVALERSARCCEVMRSRGVKNVMDSDVMNVQSGPFDTILLLMNGFGIAGTEQGLVELLSHLKGILAPGGKIVGDSTDIRYFKEALPMIDLAEQSQNEVQFEIHANGMTERFPWVFPDEVLLEALASEIGLQFRVLMYTDEYHFLCEFYQ
jgi:2-polyprenyl-3-methyl-5-hydroxy-6-metoxy-1,4-benzoquinol methylase